ncbi:MAG: glycine C-acetyltransferase [Gammaproteobacteria bacterium RIFCSPHIGHO2_12_FULL_45_12]|nr:MAG: glycine C-acetyltransferase [Gammaproteobacteria bacterium RIFCSPHIGHO2_12_FULL_45_12]
MNKQPYLTFLTDELNALKTAGLYKDERIITSPQQAVIQLEDGQEVINLCANNYLGLSDHPDLIAAAKTSLDDYGYGMSSVRFICGTQSIHKKLEASLSAFLQMEDTILYSSCFDANGGLFEALLGAEDAVISDALNHASIIDGVRLCKAARFRYQNNNMTDLEQQLKAAEHCRVKLIATDGVFSMDGTLANLKAICDLADQYNAWVMVDDSHATGLMGENGRGTPEYHHVMDRIDILTSTLGKALGGASGGFTSGRKEIIAWLRQRSRPYLFSNSLAPAMAATSVKVLEMLGDNRHLMHKLHENSRYFRRHMTEAGFKVTLGDHPIIPIMLGDAKLASTMAQALLKEGIYVVGFSYPVVPKDQARIRTQMSAGHDKHHLDQAIQAFEKIGRQLGIIN